MRSAVALIAVASFMGLLAGERTPLAAGQKQESFGDSIDVRVVNVEAVVTDKSGRRVKGLGTADFRLLVDGKEMPLEYFTEVDEGRAVTAAAAETAGETAPAVASDGVVGRSILIFIDESFSIAPQRNQVLDKIGKSLERLGPEDRVAIVAFNGHQLDLLTSWTNDPQEIASTLAVARKRKSFGQFIRAQRRLLDIAMNRAASARGTGTIDMGPGLVNNFALGGTDGRGTDGRGTIESSAAVGFGDNPGWDPMDLTTPVKNVVAAACAAMRGVSPPEGRKVLLLLSGGWPLLPREILSSSLLTPISSWMQGGIGEKVYHPLTDTANLLGYTIYPVDVPGLDAGSTGADVEQEELTPITGWSSTEWERATHSSLQLLASETGGQPVFNSARLQALDRMAEDTGSYYWIGFTPSWKADDQRHEIRLEARRTGLRIRSRRGFSDLSRRTQISMKTESLLLFGDSVLMHEPPSSGLKVELGKPKRVGVSTYKVPVTLLIPAKALTLVPAEQGFTAEMTVSVGALDRWGGRSGLPQIDIRLMIPAQPEPDTILAYRTQVQMRRAGQRLVFTVRDALTGETVWDTLSYKP
jgi:VWFA-related protein